MVGEVQTMKCRHPDIFSDFLFDIDRPFPYCEDVAFTFNELPHTEVTGFLHSTKCFAFNIQLLKIKYEK